MKPWHHIPIIDNQEKLVSHPKSLNYIEPHPYFKLGAPYKIKNSIWNLRQGVLSRLLKADIYLRQNYKNYYFVVYDSWRPLEVQEYMFYYACDNECRKNGLIFSRERINNYPEIIKKVEKFWAFPTPNIENPPPHSTGAAIDITLGDINGKIFDMGSDIDQMDDCSIPNYYEKENSKIAQHWNSRRNILKETMNKFGFVQHPNEWWHFSYGDQLWAWKNNIKNAIYGKI